MSCSKQYFKVGEARPTIEAKLIAGEEGLPIDLTDVSIEFECLPEASIYPDGLITVDGEGVRVLDEDEALVEAELPASFTSAPGKYRGEFLVTYSDGRTRVHPRTGHIALEVVARMS